MVFPQYPAIALSRVLAHWCPRSVAGHQNLLPAAGVEPDCIVKFPETNIPLILHVMVCVARLSAVVIPSSKVQALLPPEYASHLKFWLLQRSMNCRYVVMVEVIFTTPTLASHPETGVVLMIPQVSMHTPEPFFTYPELQPATGALLTVAPPSWVFITLFPSSVSALGGVLTSPDTSEKPRMSLPEYAD